MYDLLVCIRCHAHTDFVLDTIDSVLAYTDRSTTLLAAAVDGGNANLAGILRRTLGKNAVYMSKRSFGWGAGLYGLMAASLNEFNRTIPFSHFMSIDYDTLFIAPGVDHLALACIDDPSVFLVGRCGQNEHWRKTFERERVRLEALFGGVPRTYCKGEGVQGGGFVLTRTGIDTLSRRGFLTGLFADPARVTSMADDHFLPLVVRAAGGKISALPDRFKLQWSLGSDPFALLKQGVVAFHPTKLRHDRKSRTLELAVRNYYRKIRGRSLLQ